MFVGDDQDNVVQCVKSNYWYHDWKHDNSSETQDEEGGE